MQTIQTMFRLAGWQMQDLSEWSVTCHDQTWVIRIDDSVEYGLAVLVEVYHAQQWQRISQLPSVQGLEGVGDYTVARSVSKASEKLELNALNALIQGTILRADKGGPAMCCPCNAPATLEHVLLDCQWFEDRQLTIPDTIRPFLRTPSWRSVWFRSVVPQSLYGNPKPSEVASLVLKCEGCFELPCPPLVLLLAAPGSVPRPCPLLSFSWPRP